MKFFALFFLLALSFSSAVGQPSKPKTPAKPTPARAARDSAEWEKANALTEPAGRVSAIKKFLSDFPKSKHRDEAYETLAKLRSDIGNSQMIAGDLVAASDTFKAAAEESQTPIPSKLFAETFSKFLPNLFFRGAQLEAYEIAKILEQRAQNNAEQLIAIAGFYLSAELGADAKRVALEAARIAPDSAAAHQAAGLAHRMEFDLEASHASFEKALSLDANSLTAKRALAEAKRALGRSEEAATLYREVIEREPENHAAKSGLILALFDAGKRPDAESALDASVRAKADDVVLLAGAAYWYASNNEADKAVEYAQKAVTANPKYVWSHLALGRALMLQKKFVDADQVLSNARRYGNFPTVEYEIAKARLGLGLYREAADVLEKTFSSQNGEIETMLGGRVKKSAANLFDLVSFERRASIFAPTAAEDADTTARLAALLEFRTAVKSGTGVESAADRFIAGADKSKIHRYLFASHELLNKGAAPKKALELARSAVPLIAEGLDNANASAAILADELYTPRSMAAIDGRYLLPPTVPKETLSAILRGRIEELNGWALLQDNEHEQAVASLKRALAVLPANSAFSRTASWRLGTALEAGGKNDEALEAYYKGYVGTGGDAIKYAIVESLYQRVKGTTEGLEQKIGRNPIAQTSAPAAQQVAQVQTAPPTAEPTPQVPAISTPERTEQPIATPVSTPAPTPVPTPSPEAAKPLFEPVVITIPSAVKATTDTPKPCTLTFSEDVVTFKSNGGALSLVVGSDNDADLSNLTAESSSPADVEARRESIAAIKGRALFILRSLSTNTGDFTVRFAAPCGQRELKVKVN